MYFVTKQHPSFLVFVRTRRAHFSRYLKNVPGVLQESTQKNFFSRLLERSNIFKRICVEMYMYVTVCTITRGSSMSPRCLVIYRIISGHFHKQNAIPVSEVFVVTSTQPFALAQPGNMKRNHSRFIPYGLTSKTDITLAKMVENKFKSLHCRNS